MTRQIIDIGANANDGTGEPLRQAFQAVNDNFANVWAAGPVDSQVVISNNVISTNVTNLELILAGNGIGTVTVESTVVPKIDSVYDLGSPSQQFDSVYARYLYGNGRYLTGISGGSGGGGNVYFRSSPPLNPNIGDIWIDSDTAVQYLYFNDNTSNQWAEMEAYQSFSSGNVTGGNGTPGGSDTQIQFNNAGNFGGSTGFTFDSTSNVMNVPGDIVSNGNVTGDYIIGNGSQLTGLPAGYSNTNVAAYLASGNNTSNIVTTANISGNFFIGNGSQLTNISKLSNSSAQFTLLNDYTLLSGNISSPHNFKVNDVYTPDIDLRNQSGTGMFTQGASVTIRTAGTYNWTFSSSGNLNLPGNTFSVNYANGTPVNIGGGGNSFSAITMTSTPSGPSNQINYGLGNLVAWNDGGWTIGEYDASTDSYATEGIRINPGIEGPADITLPADAANVSTTVSNFIGNVAINTGDGLGNSYQWKFGNSGNLILPTTNVASTPVASGLNQTQKTISGAIETVAGNPLPSATNALNQTETIWTATNANVTSARMTLRIQYSVGPVTGMEMCDIVLAKEWGTNANVSYAISNRLRTNNNLGYANVVADLDGSNNLIVNVTNSSNLSEYYSYSVTEFNWTND